MSVVLLAALWLFAQVVLTTTSTVALIRGALYNLGSKIVESLNIPWAVILSQDSFYKDLEGEDLERAKRNEYNFDHPGRS
jgi:hypothetical protein